MIKLDSIDPIEILGLFFIYFSGVIILIEIIKTFKGRFNVRGDILNRKIKFYNKIDAIICKIKPLNRIKKELQIKYGVLNSSTENRNRLKAIKTIFYITVTTVILNIIFYFIIKIWYLFILVSISVFVFPYFFLLAVLNMKLNKLNQQFSDAVNIFITKYTSDKNKDKALQKTYLELQNPIRYEFKRLATMMANKDNIYQSITNFTKRVNYIWADVFGELLILNHTTVEDIGDELNELSILMAEDQTLEAHKKAEISETKIVNIIVAIFAVAAVVFNIAVFKGEAMNIYFERYVGVISISIAVITILFCLFLTFYFDKG